MNPATILYYIPKASGGDLFGGGGLKAVPERLRKRFADGHTRLDGSAGPDGGRGMLVTWQPHVLLSYDRTTQRWQKCGDHWRGIRTDYTPAEFAKPDPPSNGYSVLLGDGRRWIVPVAWADAPNYSIPWREGLDADGRLVRETDPQYRAVCEVAGRLWEHLNGDGTLQMEDADLRAACATALAVNYRLDLEDCLFLGLFTSESYTAIIRAILDMPALEEMLHRPKACAGPSMTSGGPASSDTTEPPGPTSPSPTAERNDP